MRIVTWNLGYMLPGPYKARANRQRQWETLVGELRPDLALLQECRPDDLGLVADATRASDERYAARWGPAGREFFEGVAAMGWAETLRAHHAAEVQTYFGARSGPYQLDHLFTDGALHGRLRQSAVAEALARAGLSDHAPLVADYDLGP